MNLRRLGIVLLVFTAGFIALWFHAKRKETERDQQTQKQPQAEADKSPTTRPASRPAGESTAAAPPQEPKAEDGEPEQAKAEETPAAEAPETKPETKPGIRPEWVPQKRLKETGPILVGSLDEKKGYLFQVRLTNRGAAVRTIKLTRYFETVADKQLHAKDPDKYEEARQEDPEKYKGHYKLLDAAGSGDNARYAFATHSLSVSGLPGKTKSIKIRLETEHWNLLPGSTPERAGFFWQLERDANFEEPDFKPKYAPHLRITKLYTVSKNDYSIKVSLKIENLSTAALKVSLDQFGPSYLEREDRRGDSRRTAIGRLDVETGSVEVDLKGGSERLEDKNPGERLVVGGSDNEQPTVWVGCTNKYFASLMYLIPQDDKQLHAPAQKAEFYFFQPKDTQGFLAGVSFPEREIAPGEVAAIRLDVFSGPKKRSLFSEDPEAPGKGLYGRLEYRSTIEGSGCFCASDQLTWGMMWLLDRFSKVALGNYGVAIILLVILVRVALHPLTKKGQVSMVKMQKLAPQMKKLKEKYKDDKQAYNREVMAMYKQGGATPILGCLPMLLQMPIWVALYSGLYTVVELRHAGLLPVWINDLAAPDALIPFGRGIHVPLISNMGGPITGFNLLPILLAVAMVLQMKMNPQSAQAAADPAQAKQSKIMMYMMPVMMLLFLYNAPSGLNLYIMTSTFAGVAEQKIIRKHIKAREAAQAAVETTVEAPGKVPRSKRPKKPKGPFWFKQG